LIGFEDGSMTMFIRHGVSFDMHEGPPGKWLVIIDGGKGGQFRRTGSLISVLTEAEQECLAYAIVKADDPPE
jgi:hypothetical protein